MTDPNPIDDPRIVTREPQPTVAVRIQQPMATLDLAAAFDTYPGRIVARLQELGSSIAGPPFGRYHAFGPDQVDVEIGFPVASVPAGLPALASCAPGDIGTSELPGGPAAVTVHRGSYDGLSAAYDELHDWIHAQPGYDDGRGPWESYLDAPGTVAEADLRTEIIWPLVVSS